MLSVLTLIAQQSQVPITPDFLAPICDTLKTRGADIQTPTMLSDGQSDLSACDIALRHDNQTTLLPLIERWIGARPIDYALQAAAGRRKQLLCIDMESTLIAEELLDVMAEHIQHDAATARNTILDITRRAMAGELDFHDALTQRLRLLAGIPQSTLEHIAKNMTLNPGAQELLHTMRANGARCYIVSGGFAFFVTRLIARLADGIDGYLCNDWVMANGELTGEICQPVCDGARKARFLIEQLSAHKWHATQSLAIGDGANDIAMLKAAGLGVAYYGKPATQAQADMCIRATHLRALLYVQGYRDSEIASS